MTKSVFKTSLDVEVSAINYGGHLAHDRLITMMHEARLRFLASLDQSEINFYGPGLILKKLTIDYKKECFWGDSLEFVLFISNLKGASFDLDYEIIKDRQQVATATVSLVAFDYKKRKISRISKEFIDKISVLSELGIK